jgi:hypothetical protein
MLTDDQKKAKHDFAMHQDNMLWSRLQLVVAIQGGVLGGMLYVRSELFLAMGLALLGTTLTILAGLTMWRDDKLGSKAFEESGVPKTEDYGPRWLRGWVFAFIALGILVTSDLLLLVYIAMR